MADIDIVTVYHCDKNQRQAEQLGSVLSCHSDIQYNFISVSNKETNIGFAPACNLGAKLGTAPFIGFLNPDISVNGQLGHYLWPTFTNLEVVIAGENFGKEEWEYRSWGCEEWVCGAAFFVRRNWFESVGGFDERYKFGWEETDLIRLAQSQSKLVKSIYLPLSHVSPHDDTLEDKTYKATHFNTGNVLFRAKWNRTVVFRRSQPHHRSSGA